MTDLLMSQLLFQDTLQSDRIGGKFSDTIAKLFCSHLLLVQRVTELCLVVDVRQFLDVEGMS